MQTFAQYCTGYRNYLPKTDVLKLYVLSIDSLPVFFYNRNRNESFR